MKDALARIAKPLGSRMFVLGMTSLLIFLVAIWMIYDLSLEEKDASALAAALVQLSIVAGVVTGGASAVNVFRERNGE